MTTIIPPTLTGTYRYAGDYIALHDDASGYATISCLTAHADGTLTLRPVARVPADQAHDAVRALPGAATPPYPSVSRTAAAGPCPCACNSGSFCGGCGHAGCGRRS